MRLHPHNIPRYERYTRYKTLWNANAKTQSAKSFEAFHPCRHCLWGFCLPPEHNLLKSEHPVIITLEIRAHSPQLNAENKKAAGPHFRTAAFWILNRTGFSRQLLTHWGHENSVQPIFLKWQIFSRISSSLTRNSAAKQVMQRKSVAPRFTIRL